MSPKVGDLRLWWIPCLTTRKRIFHYSVKNIEEALSTVAVLAEYDLFLGIPRSRGAEAPAGGDGACAGHLPRVL